MPSSAIHDSDSPIVIHPLPAPLAPLEMIWYEYSFSWLGAVWRDTTAPVLNQFDNNEGIMDD